jgi:hypothetical protein
VQIVDRAGNEIAPTLRPQVTDILLADRTGAQIVGRNGIVLTLSLRPPQQDVIDRINTSITDRSGTGLIARQT